MIQFYYGNGYRVTRATTDRPVGIVHNIILNDVFGLYECIFSYYPNEIQCELWRTNEYGEQEFAINLYLCDDHIVVGSNKIIQYCMYNKTELIAYIEDTNK